MSRRIFQNCDKVFTIEDNGVITAGDTQGYDDLAQASGHSGYNNIPNLNFIDDRTVGVLTVPTFKDNGDGTVTIGATTVHLRDNPNSTGAIIEYPVAGATLGPLTISGMQYITIHYNGGSPEYRIVNYPTQTSSSDEIIVFVVWRIDDGVIDEVHSIDTGTVGKGLANKMFFVQAWTDPYRLFYGDYTTARIAEITTPTNRTITVTGGPVYALNQIVTLGNFDSSVDRMTFTRQVAGVWTYSDETTYNNTDYCNAGVVTPIPANKYAVRWFYRSIGDAKQVFYLLGRNYYNTSDLAKKEIPYDTIPSVLRYHCMLIGRSVVQEGVVDGETETYFVSGGGGGGGGVGASGFSGESGYSGKSGYSAYSGVSGYSAYSGVSGYSAYSGVSGYSGISGFSAYSGVSGYSAYSGISGFSGYRTNIISQAHTFAVGDVIRYDGGTNTYIKAQADSVVNAEVIGIVTAVPSGTVFEYITHGIVSGLVGLTDGDVYFLSETTAGLLTDVSPTDIGEVSKPLLLATSSTEGIFFNFRGVEIVEDRGISGYSGYSGGGGSGGADILQVQIFS